MEIIAKFEPKYVVVATPNRMHYFFREEAEEFRDKVIESGALPILTANFITDEKLSHVGSSTDISSLPEGYHVLPKIVRSLKDIFQ